MNKGIQYIFRVCAVNVAGKSEFIELIKPIETTGSGDKPNPPQDLQVEEVTKNSCILSWRPPAIDKKSPIYGYHIERRVKAGRDSWIKINSLPITDLYFQSSDLVSPNEYEFRVIAENRSGFSEASNSVSVVAKDPYKVPGKPTNLQVTDISKRSCRLSWRPPISDGGDQIRNYVLEFRSRSSFAWQKDSNVDPFSTSCKINGLAMGEEYEFRIAAENRAGVGPWSDVTEAIKVEEPVITERPIILCGLQDITAVAGKHAKLECDLYAGEPMAQIKWYKDKREVYSGQKAKPAYDPYSQLATLSINSVDLLDEGRYTCEALNPSGKVSSTCRLTVQCSIQTIICANCYIFFIILALPTIDRDAKNLENIEAVENSPISLPVNFIGQPKPKVTWMKNGIPIRSKLGVQLDQMENYACLNINNASMSDSGKYTVQIENGVGKDHTEFNVSVKGKWKLNYNM